MDTKARDLCACVLNVIHSEVILVSELKANFVTLVAQI